MHVLPPRRQRQAHQDTLYPRTRSGQPKCCAAVVHQVKLNVPPSPNLLPMLLRCCEWHVLPLVDNGQVRWQESRQAVLNEAEQLLLVLLCLVKVVKEDAAYTTCLAAVLVIKVLITPLLEAWVVCLVVLVARLLDLTVEVYRILIIEVRGREVAASTVPPGIGVAELVGGLEVAVIQVDGWRVGVVRVQDQR